jgi:hypothetical protein
VGRDSFHEMTRALQLHWHNLTGTYTVFKLATAICFEMGPPGLEHPCKSKTVLRWVTHRGTHQAGRRGQFRG